MGKKRLIPIVYVQWVDAHSNTGWFTGKALDDWCAVGDWWTDDVGYLLRETKRHLIFAQRHDPERGASSEEQWGALHKIPKAWVRNKRVLGYLKPDGSIVLPGKRS